MQFFTINYAKFLLCQFVTDCDLLNAILVASKICLRSISKITPSDQFCISNEHARKAQKRHEKGLKMNIFQGKILFAVSLKAHI